MSITAEQPAIINALMPSTQTVASSDIHMSKEVQRNMQQPTNNMNFISDTDTCENEMTVPKIVSVQSSLSPVQSPIAENTDLLSQLMSSLTVITQGIKALETTQSTFANDMNRRFQALETKQSNLATTQSTFANDMNRRFQALESAQFNLTQEQSNKLKEINDKITEKFQSLETKQSHLITSQAQLIVTREQLYKELTNKYKDILCRQDTLNHQVQEVIHVQNTIAQDVNTIKHDNEQAVIELTRRIDTLSLEGEKHIEKLFKEHKIAFSKDIEDWAKEQTETVGNYVDKTLKETVSNVQVNNEAAQEQLKAEVKEIKENILDEFPAWKAKIENTLKACQQGLVNTRGAHTTCSLSKADIIPGETSETESMQQYPCIGA
ncbi:uncharacterized protein LOC126482219 [Schistocerca serialis cubense]|uniref:uncharacterized protein LOC126482219 n=1 Tax=Schistocerca serialis cubense TaxID=2023355 RepID=UPI00214E4359|nr:uncharacterized protein LOC126482219 [Schistocerca serialis cubense]